MNIAIISYHTCPLATLGGKDTGGMNVYVRDLTRQLGKSGIHVDVFTRSQDEHVPNVLHDLGYGNRVVHIPAGLEVPLPKNELVHHIAQFIDGIIKFTEKKGLRYNIIHSHYWLSGIAAIKLKEKWNLPIIHMFHTLSRLKNINISSIEKVEGEYREKGEQEVMDKADRIIAATDDEAEKIDQLYEIDFNKIAVIPPGVDTSRFYPIQNDEAKAVVGVPKDESMILFVGRIEPLKGVDKLIRAMADLHKADVFSECPHYLIIIGGDPDSPVNKMNQEMMRLKKLCKELDMQNLILFLGKKDQDSLPYYYSAADMVVVPSYYESFGLVALEAMACGTPVIATQVGGLSYIVKNGLTGYTIPIDDSNALEEGLTKLICRPELRRTMSLNCIEFAQSFSWEKISPRIIEQYQNLTHDK